MKKALLILSSLPFLASAQIVNIPDANFKSELLAASPSNYTAQIGTQYVTIDTNGDGEIQQAEAAIITGLSLTSSNLVANFEGIQSFTAMTRFFVYDHNAAAIDFSGMTALKRLDLPDSNNPTPLNSLDLTGCTGLESLRVESTQLTSTAFLNAVPTLKELHFEFNPIVGGVLDVTGFPLLQILEYGPHYSVPGVLNASGLSALNELTITGSSELINSIDLSNCTALYFLNLNNANTVVSVNVSGCSTLHGILAEYANMEQINLSGCVNLAELSVRGNHLQTLDLSDNELLHTVDVRNNQLAALDVSPCHALSTFIFSGMPQLHTLNIKNGRNESMIFQDVSNLEYICVDDSQLTTIVNQLAAIPALSDVVVNSYCTFTPGGNYNTVAGIIHFDTDNDGCSAADEILPAVRINVNDGTNTGAIFSNASGEYEAFSPSTNITLTPQVENPAFFNITPATQPVTFPDNDNHLQTINFCMSANGVHPDVEIILVPLVPGRPGFDAKYALTLRNKGNQTVSGVATVTFNDAVLDFISASSLPDVQGTNTLGWNYAALLPFESRAIYFTLNVNSPVETPAVNINDILAYTATATAAADEFPADNTFTLNQIVVGAFDPNDKHCMQGDVVSQTQIGDYLHYVVNFENTGTFAAENVVVKDLIDTDKFDINSLQVLGASHSEIPTIAGSKVEFVFQGINLQPNEYGYVAFKIKTKSNLAVNTTVTNKADIYFDFNFPVETNTASTTFQALGVGVPIFDNSVTVFPNPATQDVNVRAAAIIKSVTIFDLRGRPLLQRDADSTQFSIDVSALESGVYVIKTTTDDGTKTERFVKK